MPPKWPIADGCAISATLQIFSLRNSASFQHDNIRRHDLILMEVWVRVANARAKRCTQVRMDAYRWDALFDRRPFRDCTVDNITFVSEMHTCKFYSSQMDRSPESILLSGHSDLSVITCLMLAPLPKRDCADCHLRTPDPDLAWHAVSGRH